MNLPDGALQISRAAILLKYLLHWLDVQRLIEKYFFRFGNVCTYAVWMDALHRETNYQLSD